MLGLLVINKATRVKVYQNGLLHSYAAAVTVIYAPRRFFETIELFVLKRDHYHKETKMRKSRITLIKITLL